MARRSEREAKERRTNLLVALVLGFLVFAVAVLALRPGLIFSVGNEGYGSSVGRTVEGGHGGICRSNADGEMACSVDMDPGSGAIADLTVTKRARGCWTAKPESSAYLEGDAGPIKGCVTAADILMPDKPGIGLD